MRGSSSVRSAWLVRTLIRSTEVIENTSDSESIYMNVEDAEKMSNPSEICDNIYLNTMTEIPGSAGASERRKLKVSNRAAVGLGFLCVLLLTVIIVLCIKHNIELHQIQSSCNKMTVERDRLQSSYNNMTVERDKLQNLNNNLTSEKNQLQSSYNTLKLENDAIQQKLTEMESCPSGWTRFLSNCYFISSLQNTWEMSREDCRRNGTDLVIINSREEQQFVSRLCSGKNIWIGLTDRDQEGQWKWVDDTPLESGFWKNNEPNNIQHDSGDEDCAELRSDVNTSPALSNWNDIQCSQSFYALCEKKTQSRT